VNHVSEKVGDRIFVVEDFLWNAAGNFLHVGTNGEFAVVKAKITEVPANEKAEGLWNGKPCPRNEGWWWRRRWNFGSA
jgi:hypothetical protein